MKPHFTVDVYEWENGELVHNRVIAGSDPIQLLQMLSNDTQDERHFSYGFARCEMIQGDERHMQWELKVG